MSGQGGIPAPASTSSSATPASEAVASACLGAVLIADLRSSGSRRALGKAAGIPPSVLSDIEDASVLPSTHQLAQLEKHLHGIRPDLFAKAARWGEIPWTDAVREVLVHRQGQRVEEIAQSIARSAQGLDPGAVKWRLARQLARLEGAGELTQRADGTWEAAPTTTAQATGTVRPGRWRKHVLDVCAAPEQDALFHLESEPGHHRIVLNRSHPHYPAMHAVLNSEQIHDLSAEELRGRLREASALLRGLARCMG